MIKLFLALSIILVPNIAKADEQKSPNFSSNTTPKVKTVTGHLLGKVEKDNPFFAVNPLAGVAASVAKHATWSVTSSLFNEFMHNYSQRYCD